MFCKLQMIRVPLITLLTIFRYGWKMDETGMCWGTRNEQKGTYLAAFDNKQPSLGESVLQQENLHLL